jgi:hypothetical protein
MEGVDHQWHVRAPAGQTQFFARTFASPHMPSRIIGVEMRLASFEAPAYSAMGMYAGAINGFPS